MISMTGFVQGAFHLTRLDARVSIRSWNHRFFELQVRGQALLPVMDRIIRESVRREVSRGKVEVSVDLRPRETETTGLKINEKMLTELLEKTEPLRRRFSLQLNLDTLLRLPMFMTISGAEADEFSPADEEAFSAGFQRVLAEFRDTCRREGTALQLILQQYARDLDKILDELELEEKSRLPLSLQAYRERLHILLQELPVDENRIALEAAVLAEKTCIAEETARLRVHCRRLQEIFSSNQASKGRESDFLLQEMQRETQTIGAKTDSQEIGRMVFDAKCAIEKIRQQIQNIA